MSQTTIKGTQVYDRSIDPLYDLKLPTGSNSASIALLGDGTWGTPPSASYAVSASWAPGGSSVSSSYANSSSWSDNVISASYAQTASYANQLNRSASISVMNYQLTDQATNNLVPNYYSSFGVLSLNNIVKLDAGSFMRGITGIMSQSINTKLILINTGSNSIYITGEHPSSSAANRILYHEDIIISQYQSVELFYDVTLARWLVTNYSPKSTFRILSNIANPGTVTAGDAGHWGLLTVSGGAATNSEAEISNIGTAWRLATGTTSAKGAQIIYLNKAFGSAGTVGSHHLSAEATVAVDTLSTGAQGYMIEVGLCAAAATAVGICPSSSCGIRYTDISSSGNFEGWSHGNASAINYPIRIDLGVPVVVDTVYNLRTEISRNREVRFYINGDLKGVIAADISDSKYMLTGGAAARASITKTVGTSNRFLYVSQLHGRVLLK